MASKYIVAGVLSAGLALSAHTASASSLTLEYLGFQSGQRTLSIKESPVTPANGSVPANLAAGGFKMKDKTPGGTLGTFVAWCLDVSNWLVGQNDRKALPYDVTTTPFSNTFAIDQARVQAYFDANYSTTIANSRNSSAAFQAGLWEVLYDDDYSLSNDTAATDDFRGTISNNATSNLAASYLDAAKNYKGLQQKWTLTFFESTADPQGQNLVTAEVNPNPINPIPLPATGLLLLGGLGGLAMFRRGRKAA